MPVSPSTRYPVNPSTCNAEAQLSFAHKVETLKYVLLCKVLVEFDVSNAAHQGEVDNPVHILLVVQHQVVQVIVIVACKGKHTIVLTYELHRLPHLLCGETSMCCAEEQFAQQAVGHGIAMQNGALLFKGKTFKGVAYGVSQIESLAYAMLVWVFRHDTFLASNALYLSY